MFAAYSDLFVLTDDEEALRVTGGLEGTEDTFYLRPADLDEITEYLAFLVARGIYGCYRNDPAHLSNLESEPPSHPKTKLYVRVRYPQLTENAFPKRTRFIHPVFHREIYVRSWETDEVETRQEYFVEPELEIMPDGLALYLDALLDADLEAEEEKNDAHRDS